MTLVDSTRTGSILTLTMANPAKLNAFNAELLEELIAALEQAQGEGTRVIVIRAQPGVRTWSAGQDITELPRDRSDPLTWSNPLESLFRAVRQCPVPVIAAVEGSVWGGACNLVMAADLIVATRSATFAITPAKLGIPYNSAGIAHFVGALPLNIAKEMFFTADPISAEALAGFGVVNRLVDDADALTATVDEIATRIASLAPLAIRAIKAEMNALTDARPMTSELFEHLTSLRRNAWRSNDYQEGLAAFLQRRTPDFTGS